MKVAAYVRVSTDEQADKGNSLEEQQERLAAYCKAMGWERPTFYIDDGYSAKSLTRPEMQRLIQDIKERQFDVIITAKLDRLTRKLRDLLDMVDFFDEYNCNYVSASESFDTSTAVGRMVLQLLGVFAEFERERTSERVTENMNSIAKKTTKAITRPCFGYDVVDAQYVINDKEAAFVRLMFDLAEEGHGHRMIAKILNERGATTKKGNLWDQMNVKRLMMTETIAGMRVYNKRTTKNGKVVERDRSEWLINENNHPAIIPPERFAKVQDIMKSRSRAGKHADSETYLLTGLVKCKHCGKNMKGSTARHKSGKKIYTYYRYVCSSYVLGYGCKYHAVHRDDLESLIIDNIRMISEASEKDIKLSVSQPYSVKDEIKSLTSQLASLDKRMQKQIEAYENDLISADDLKAASERVKRERESVRSRLREAEARVPSDTMTIVKKAELLLSDITNIDRKKAKKSIRELIDSVEIQNGELIEITWKS